MMRLPASYRDPKIFNNKYIIKQQISSGSFGVVYLAIDKHTREEVAVKIEKEENEDVSTLDREIAIFNRLVGVSGIPKLYWSGFEQDYNVIVIQLLGKDLSYYMKTHKKLSLKSVLQISTQILLVLQIVHERGVIHRDFKPENILTGYGQENGTIYLVDFGVSKIYVDSQGRHIPLKDKKSFIGTTRYASIAAHRGLELGRKDDIESMFYVMIYFLRGKLPWQNLQNIGDRDRTELVGEVKMTTELNEVCRDCPHEFAEILMYLKNLEFKSEPDYKMILSLLNRAASNAHITLDKQFEWTEKPKETKIKDQMIWAVAEEKKVQTSNLLKPPDPLQLKNNASSPLRGDQKHPTSTSIQGSLSSMMIKYTPSQIDNSSQKKPLDNKSKKSKKSKKSRKSSKYSKTGMPIAASDVQVVENNQRDQFKRHKTTDSTWGFQACMDEYSDDSPKLNEKLKCLQCLPCQFKIKKKMGQQQSN